LEYTDAIYTIKEKTYEIKLLALSEYSLSVAIENSTSADSELILDTILKQIPKTIYEKLEIKKFYRTIVRVKTKFKISNFIKDEYINKLDTLKTKFPNFRDTDKEIRMTGFQLRIAPIVKGIFAQRIVKGLEPMVTYLLDFHIVNSADHEKNILTIIADLEDTKIKQILKEI
jgi:hypothetical protein